VVVVSVANVVKAVVAKATALAQAKVVVSLASVAKAVAHVVKKVPLVVVSVTRKTFVSDVK
jgi:hypothetical protein